MVTWSQSNQRGGNDGYYPGLDTSGNVVPNGPLTGYSGDGTQPAARLWMLLNGGFLAPEDLASPLDTHHAELAVPPGGPIPPVTHEHFSYALQSLAGHPGERDEWKQTLNTATVVMGDRAIGTGPADISSDWTEQGSGDWRGAVVRNDNSTAFETRPALNNTRYGQHPSQSLDNLFEDEPAHADAYLVHDDATTSHSKD